MDVSSFGFPGLGTVINMGAILVGGVLGFLFGRFLTPQIQRGLTLCCGISVLFIAIQGAVTQMNAAAAGPSVSGGALVIVLSLAFGTLIGEVCHIQQSLDRFGAWLQRKTGSSNDKGFIKGFVSTSLTVCVGAMAVVGAINDAILQDYTILEVKSLLDAIIVMVMTCSLGKGCVFSTISVGVFQGFFTALAVLVEPLLTEGALMNLSMVGSILIFCVGVNLVWGDHETAPRIAVANMLPAIVIAPALSFLPFAL